MRLASVAGMGIQNDGAVYFAMGKSLALHGNLILPWGDGINLSTLPAPSHQYGPIYPAYLALFYRVLGAGIWQSQIANATLAIGGVAVFWACTKDLCGRRAAWLATGVFACIPRFAMAAGTGFSENMIILLVTLTLWAALRGLADPYGRPTSPGHLALLGLFAGLTYLSRAGLGPLIFPAVLGAGGFWVWRNSWQAFRNTGAILGGVLFFGISGAWMWRNATALRTVDVSGYNAGIAGALGHPWVLGAGVLFKFAQYAMVLAIFYAVFKPELVGIKPHRSNQVLKAAVVLGFVAALFMSALIYAIERTPPFWMDSERYLAVVYVPLLWLVFRNPDSKTLQVRAFTLAALFLTVGAYEVIEPTASLEGHAAQSVAAYIHPGATIGDLKGALPRYAIYPYVPEGVHEVVCQGPPDAPCGAAWPDLIMGKTKLDNPRYALLRADSVHFVVGGDSAPIYAYVKV